MKKHLQFTITMIFFSAFLFGQGHKGGGGGGGGAAAAKSGSSPSASSGSAATSGGQVGYVYYLKNKQHIHYSELSTETYYFKKSDLDSNKIKTIFGETVEKDKLILAAFTLDRKANRFLTTGGQSLNEYYFRPFQKQLVCIKAPDCKYLGSGDDTLLIVTVSYYDSLPRYWNREKDLFKRNHLRLAITQDSARLNARIIYPIVDNSVKIDIHAVSNPNYTFSMGSRSKKEKEQIGLFSNEVFYAVYKNKEETPYEKLLAKYNKSAKEYLITLFNATARTRQLLSATYRAEVDQKYQEMLTDYVAAIKEYNKELEEKKGQLDYARDQTNDPGDSSQISSQLYFLDGLYQVNNVMIQPPSPLPVDLIHETILEAAIPVSENDSVNNFYFNVIRKRRINQSIFYRPFHFGTWDYGTVTIPFRYRFAVPDAHIISQAGKPNTTVSVPEQSDATISLSMYFGRKWGRTRFYEDPAMTTNLFSYEATFFTGPSLIALSLSNVDSSSKYVGGTNNYNYTGPSNILAWSVGVGFVTQWKTINFGVFGGLDIPMTAGTGWVYAYKPWIGFGIGVNLGMLASGSPN